MPPRIEAFVAHFVSAHPDEIPTLLHACLSFFFLLSAYFMVLPFRDEAAISLGTGALPMLFIASLLLTLVAAPISSHLLSLPALSKSKALFIMYRFFGISLALFFLLYSVESFKTSSISSQGYLGGMMRNFRTGPTKNASHNIFIGLRVCFYIWIALLNLFTTSALWARLTDVFNSEAGSRLFGLVGAGATLGQLTGSVLAVLMAPFGSFLLLLSAVFMELAARSAIRISGDHSSCSNTLNSSIAVGYCMEADSQKEAEANHIECSLSWVAMTDKIYAMLEGLRLVLASNYLLHVCCFLWLTAVISSFFYLQRTNVVAEAVLDPLGRRMLFAKINSFTAVFILFGQLTITGRILPFAGITAALCASPMMACMNMTAIAISPTPLVIAISEASRKVITYVVTRPGRELLFTVTSQEEKYKAKVFIDTFVQRLGDAVAAGIYEIIGSLLLMGPSAVAVCSLPVCVGWFFAGLTLGRRQQSQAHALAAASPRLDDVVS